MVTNIQVLIKKCCCDNSRSTTCPPSWPPSWIFEKKNFFAKLLETFDWNLKYCVLNNSVMCVDDFSVMFLLQIGSKR